MDNKQIKEALQGIFAKEKHRIVFWYDGEQEFAETLPELGMYDADVLCLDVRSRSAGNRGCRDPVSAICTPS
jgi:hypothetical protein